jgi:DNA invertase Pin-like site-specific DNA recombinase
MSPRKIKRPTLRPGWVIYGRTSDEDAQAPERSLGSQRRLCMERLIGGSRLDLLGEYDDIFSGRSTDRKHYQRLLADARDGKFSHVAIAFVDRFGRNDVEGIRAFDELQKLGVTIRIATYPSLDPATPDGRMIVTMLFGVSRFESDRIGQRCREGMHTKLLGGEWTWKAPDGYVNRELRLSECDRDERLKHARYKRWVEQDPVQSRIWRLAWDLLLEDRLSLKHIAEELFARGHCLRSGIPFVLVKPDGRRIANVKTLSRAFHNWFYAGWVVIDTDWAQIAPKTVRGSWEPIVTTEEFEAGLAILDKRNQNRSHHKKHFYLLQGLIYLQQDSETVTKLTCSMPNANRDRGGVPYYCIPSSNVNFLCHEIDSQVASWMHNIQVDDKYLPRIREAYVTELEGRVGTRHSSERSALEKALKDLADEELRCARQHAKKQLSDETWDILWREWQDQRSAIKATLEAMDRNCEVHIATLDDALRLVSKAGILFDRLPQAGQQDLLRHVVKRVIISPEGQIVRMELRTPFSYLYRLAAGTNGARGPKNGSGSRKNKTSGVRAAGSSYVSLGAPTGV